ncbi:GumC family protein [Hymenobacter sp. B1770]|uniref:GumC family protein n=1 Tax=Hymenobacter sp. B1770 TaxID=1718788 RepID=UPI003CFB0DB3
MSLYEIFRLLKRKWVLLLLVPLVLSVSTYFFARQLPQTYSSDTTIYTGIASGYSLTGNAAADYNTTNNAFDNLINLITSRSTKEEVVYSLLAKHLFETSQQPSLLTSPTYEGLRESLPARLRQQLTGTTQEATLDKVRAFAQTNASNPVQRLLNSANPTYSLAALKNLTASRIGASDLVRLYFDSHDPDLARTTLSLVTQVFLNQSRNLREGQTTSVIKYYEEELKRAKERLDKAEAENLAFNRENNIINFESQSNNVAMQKEALAGQLTEMNQQYAGAQAALNAVNRKLGGRQASLMSSAQMIEQRRKLSRLSASIADQELFGQNDPNKTKQLKAEADRAAQAIQNNVDVLSVQSSSAEGIPNKDLLGEWVQNMVLVESNKAKLDVMNRRRQEFEREYQRMAPLGATLKRIGREIELAEKAYLSVLASLNASKATQQNTALTANLKIVDPPNLPSQPKSNKLLMMVLLSGLGGFVCVAGTIVGLGLLDKSLKNPSEAMRQIGLPVAGMTLDSQAPPTKQLQAAQQRSLDQLVRHILLKANTSPVPPPFVVGIFSVQRQEGKTTLCQGLSQRCHEMGVQTLALYPDTDGANPGTDAPSLFYPSEAAAVQGWQLDQLIQHATPKRMSEISSPDVQVVLVEFPALREEALPVGLLRQLNLVFLTVPATRAWRMTDHQTVEQLRSATSAPVEVVLSGVSQHHGEEAMA